MYWLHVVLRVFSIVNTEWLCPQSVTAVVDRGRLELARSSAQCMVDGMLLSGEIRKMSLPTLEFLLIFLASSVVRYKLFAVTSKILFNVI